MSIAIVLSISGQAWARDASGNLRELSVGDTLREGETVVTSQGGGVELDFGDNTAPTQIQGGEQVALTPELNAEELLEPSEFAALDQDIEALLAALDDETIDLLDVLDATAAGAGGGGAADGGHNFVRLARIAEGTGAQSFEFGSVSATDIPAVEEAGAAPQAALDELPSEPLNGVPNALDDFFSTDEESLLSGVNVLDNDSDPDGDALSISDPGTREITFVGPDGLIFTATVVLGADGFLSLDPRGGFDALAVGEQATGTFTYTVADGRGGFSTAKVTLTIVGTNDAPVIGGVASGEVTEDGTTTTTGQLSVSDVDVSDTHTWSVQGANVGTYGSFSVDANGQWTYVLDNASPAVQGLVTGQQVTDSFTVEVSDGKGGTDTQVVTVTIHGTNDQAQVIVSATGVDSTVYEAGLISVENNSEAANGSFQVTATDGIAHITVGGQQFSLSQLQGFSSGSPSAAIVTPMGTLYLTGYSGTANAGTISYQYTLKEVQTHGGQGSATDGVLTDTIVVVVKGVGDSAMTGHLTIAIVDDVPQASNDLGGTVTEDSADNVLSGNVLSNDSFGADGPAGGVATVNWNASAAQLADIGQYGTLVLNTDGSWSFTLDNSLAKVQALKASDLLTFNLGYTITDGDGDSASATLGFSIRGADDSASVTVSTQGADSTVYEAGLTSLADTRETAGGSFQISASDGIATLNVMGQVFTLAQLQGFSGASPSAGIITNMGTLYLTGFSGTATEGTVSYQYTLSAAQSHGAPGSATNNVLTDSISLSVSGVGGSSAGGTLSVAIIDDAPTFETIMNAIIANESGTTLSGLHDLTMGADGAGAIIVADPTIAGINGYIAYSTTAHADGSVTKLAKVNGIDFFTLTIKVDGTYDFTLHEARPSIVKTVNFGGVQGGKSVEQLILGDVVLRAVDSNGNNKIDNGEMISPSSAGFGVGNGNIDAGEKFIISFVNNKVIENIDFSYKHQGSTDFRMTWQSNTGETGTVGPISQDGWISINPAQDFTSITFTVLQGSGKIDGVKYGELVLPGDTFVNFDIHGIDADGDISATQTLSVKLLGAGSTSVAITGTAEDEVIVGTSANDTINGGEGNDILIGGAGNDTLIGGEGDDVFQWNFGDQGGVGSAAHDVVKDFSLGINTLDLADLLQGEAAETIDSFIFAVQEGSSTVLYVNHEGSIGANGSNATQVIVLENFSMDGASSTDFLQVMLENGQLHIDQ
ncbi:retention module-containing protein [Billgrantia desiderata]|uniref:retention module-containing protein n=1 Tax=Billgrantia desiderata TaxID=52021 RepID=UPI00089F1EE1|nr:retention module-containing protein [Halomonas desiderata]SEG42436.1 type I secretion C-terminal target domain (VC_A0849 subclass) [Halomonas desiderata]